MMIGGASAVLLYWVAKPIVIGAATVYYLGTGPPGLATAAILWWKV